MPGIIFSSFSVAVLTSNLAANNLLFLLVLGGEAAGGAATGTVRDGLGTVVDDAIGVLDGSIFSAQPPSLCCLASSSSCSSLWRSAVELEAPGGVALVPWILARPFEINCSPRSPSLVCTNAKDSEEFTCFKGDKGDKRAVAKYYSLRPRRTKKQHVPWVVNLSPRSTTRPSVDVRQPNRDSCKQDSGNQIATSNWLINLNVS